MSKWHLRSLCTSLPTHRPSRFDHTRSGLQSHVLICSPCMFYNMLQPSFTPTGYPTSAPTFAPTSAPTYRPTWKPSLASAPPSSKPTFVPTSAPTYNPTSKPTYRPTSAPTNRPTSSPTSRPTGWPSFRPSGRPSNAPTGMPTTDRFYKAGWIFQRVKVNGHMSSTNIRKACNAKKLVPACDHTGYNDGYCVPFGVQCIF